MQADNSNCLQQKRMESLPQPVLSQFARPVHRPVDWLQAAQGLLPPQQPQPVQQPEVLTEGGEKGRGGEGRAVQGRAREGKGRARESRAGQGSARARTRQGRSGAGQDGAGAGQGRDCKRRCTSRNDQRHSPDRTQLAEALQKQQPGMAGAVRPYAAASSTLSPQLGSWYPHRRWRPPVLSSPPLCPPRGTAGGCTWQWQLPAYPAQQQGTGHW